MTQPLKIDRYSQLRERVLNRTATAMEIDEFESIVSQSADLRRDFLEHLQQEAILWQRLPKQLDMPLPETSVTTRDEIKVNNKPKRHYLVGTAIAATIALLAVSFAFIRSNQSDDTFRIVNARNCQWASSTVPVTENSPLSPGRLTLTSGLAVLELPNVSISIEGGCDIEVIDMRRCRLYRGRAYAEVKKGGEGFVIETPTSVLVDRGTAFTVSVSDSGQTDIKVVKGLVDVAHRTTGESASVKTSEKVRSTHQELQAQYDFENLSTPNDGSSGKYPVGYKVKQLQVSTAMGSGRDCYVIRDREKPETITSGLLIAKTTSRSKWQMPWCRRIYIHFDLSSLSASQLTDATLQLEGVSTGIGFLSRTPDTTFAAYGLQDEAQENWSEQSISWENSPGVLEDNETIDTKKMVLLGQFTVQSDRVNDRYTIHGEPLTRFLAADTTGGATMMIVSETAGPDESWAHGFASRRHNVLTPPTLRLNLIEP